MVINKIDRPDARPHEVLDEIFDLFVELGADDAVADFPYIFASGRDGYATHDPAERPDSMQPLLDLVLEQIPGPEIDADAPLQMLVTTLDWSDYVGRIAIGRIFSGRISRGRTGRPDAGGRPFNASKVASVHVFDKLGRKEVAAADSRRHRGGGRPGRGRNRRHDQRCRSSPRPAARGGRRADPADGVRHQQFALGGQRRQVRHQPPSARPADASELERNVALRVEPIAGHAIRSPFPAAACCTWAC